MDFKHCRDGSPQNMAVFYIINKKNRFCDVKCKWLKWSIVIVNHLDCTIIKCFIYQSASLHCDFAKFWTPHFFFWTPHFFVWTPQFLKWSVNRVPACRAGVEAGCFRLCRVAGNTDPIWQVTLRSCEMDFHK